LNCLMNLDFEVALSRLWQKELVVDATPGDGELIDKQRELLNFEEYIGEASGEVNLEQQIELPGSFTSMERILACSGTPREVTAEASEGKVLLEGGLDLGVIYVSEGVSDRKLQLATWNKTAENELSLAGILEFPGLQSGTMLRTHLMIDSLKVEMIDDRRFKLSGVIKVRVLARTPRALFVMRDCAIVIPVEPSTRPSMLFYAVQADDTLWKIARRYQTTVDTLVKSNQITSPDNIEVGQKLLIPKRIMNM
jgi:LysM repeat protein